MDALLDLNGSRAVTDAELKDLDNARMSHAVTELACGCYMFQDTHCCEKNRLVHNVCVTRKNTIVN